MKNLVYNNTINIHEQRLLNHARRNSAKILSFKPDQNNHYILKVKIDNLNKDNFKILQERENLTVIVYKSIEISKPFHVHNFNQKDIIDELNYNEIESYDFTLPDKNYYLIRHKISPVRNTLQITLGRIHYN
jgi:hypothetical protein